MATSEILVSYLFLELIDRKGFFFYNKKAEAILKKIIRN